MKVAATHQRIYLFIYFVKEVWISQSVYYYHIVFNIRKLNGFLLAVPTRPSHKETCSRYNV